MQHPPQDQSTYHLPDLGRLLRVLQESPHDVSETLSRIRRAIVSARLDDPEKEQVSDPWSPSGEP